MLLKVVAVDSETDSFNFATFLKYEGTKRKELGKSFEMKNWRKQNGEYLIEMQSLVV